MTSWTRSAALLTAAVALSACSSSASGSSSAPAGEDEPLSVTVGFYPYQFVAERIGGPDAEVTNLTAPGTEPHDLELTPRQVAALGDTDLVLYSPQFQPAVDEAVEQQAQDKAFDVLSAVELRDPPVVEGEEPEEAEAPDGKDPHVWLDPVRLGEIAAAVADRMAELDPDGAAGYSSRADELQAELGALDDQMRAGLASCRRTEVVTSHDAYGYLTAAYDLTQVPIAGLSPEDEASAGRLAEIAVQAEASGVTTIFFEELVSPAVARSLADEVGAEATVLSPLEGPPETGDYLTEMRTTLQTLRTALDCA